MSKLKRMQRKRADQKKSNIRLMSLHGGMKEAPGSGKLLKRMTRDHQDVLENIEFILVSGYRDDGRIDDRIIAVALKAAISGDTAEDALAESLNKGLEEMRRFRSDVSDDIWRDGLRTVLQSVQRHSNLRPGEREYLDFVSDFIF
jgi:single-stranded DNA-specific DHH superfamily exonuclease